MNAEEKARKGKQFVNTVDWNKYDYTKAPGADMSFPDYREEDADRRDIWIGKHYNKTSRMNCVHVTDLNAITEGAERRMHALYGVPVEWPTREEAQAELYAVIDKIDAARAKGGPAYNQVLDQHGVINDEHYVWLRGRKLGIPEPLLNYEAAKAAMAKIKNAQAQGDSAFKQALSAFGIKDKLHFEALQKTISKAEKKAWGQVQGVLDETNKKLAQEFESNKQKLSGDLAPFKGMSMEAWAGANAALVQGQPLEAVLDRHRLDRPTWDAINAEWNARMSRDTTATIATVYGQAFMAAPATKQKSASKDPMSFEQWVKITEHINAASAQGVDPNRVLAHYQLNAADWGTIGGYWATKMSTEPMTYLADYQRYSAQYGEEFRSGSANADIDF